jgi:alkylated DNA nucleotide flippase Atl1
MPVLAGRNGHMKPLRMAPTGGVISTPHNLQTCGHTPGGHSTKASGQLSSSPRWSEGVTYCDAKYCFIPMMSVSKVLRSHRHVDPGRIAKTPGETLHLLNEARTTWWRVLLAQRSHSFHQDTCSVTVETHTLDPRRPSVVTRQHGQRRQGHSTAMASRRKPSFPLPVEREIARRRP